MLVTGYPSTMVGIVMVPSVFLSIAEVCDSRLLILAYLYVSDMETCISTPSTVFTVVEYDFSAHIVFILNMEMMNENNNFFIIKIIKKAELFDAYSPTSVPPSNHATKQARIVHARRT